MKLLQYSLPKVGVVTNQKELMRNQQRILQQNYQSNNPQQDGKQREQKRWPMRSKLSDLNPFQSEEIEIKQQSMLEKSYSQSKVGKSIHQQIIKNALSNQLSQQIALKQQLKKERKRQELMKQKETIKFNKELQDHEFLKQKSFLQTFKHEAIKNVEFNQIKKQKRKIQEALQKQTFAKLYRNSQNIIQKRILGLLQPKPPYTVDTNASFQIDKFKLNPEQQACIIPKKSSHKPSREQSAQLVKSLKETLLQQMKIKVEKKKMEKIKQWNTPFIEEKFKNVDNPITNPVDIRIAKDNPYVMKQLLGQKVASEAVENAGVHKQKQKEPSYLSRRGSNSLLKLALQ